MHVPDLKKKLEFLYQYDPDINTDAQLASAMGMSQSSISGYIHGSETRRPEQIPDKRVHQICDLFFLLPHWLDLPYDEFVEQVVNTRGGGPDLHLWERLLLQTGLTETGTAVTLNRPPVSDTPAATRKLVPEAEYRPLERYQVGERVYISLAPAAAWQGQETPETVHMVLLGRDQEGVTCHFTTEPGAPHPAAGTLTLPDDAPDQCFRVDGPLGRQELTLILTQEPIPKPVYEALQQEDINKALDLFARHLKKQSRTTWRVARTAFEVH